MRKAPVCWPLVNWWSGLVASPQVLASLIDVVRSWLGRNRARSVSLTSVEMRLR